MKNKFIPGDRIICIDNTGYAETLLLGSIYTVVGPAKSEDYPCVRLRENQKQYYEYRFILSCRLAYAIYSSDTISK